MVDLKVLLGFCLLFFTGSISVFGQDVIFNEGAHVHLQQGGILSVKGHLNNSNNGTIEHEGTIFISGDWNNNTPNFAFTPNSVGSVVFDGNIQIIGGSEETKFYNLLLEGNSEKRLAINSIVTNELDLRDASLETNSFQVFLTNPSSNSLKWNTGYISSANLGGGLSRSVNKSQSYVFPVGNISLDKVYRPVIITPLTSDSSVYSVRLGAVNPDVDFSGTSLSGAVGPFDVSSKEDGIDEINSGFYHNIFKSYGNTDADISIQYFASDGGFHGVANWTSQSIWEQTLFEREDQLQNVPFVNAPNKEFKFLDMNTFNHDVFALISKEAKLNVPNIFSPNGDGNNDMFQILVENELVESASLVIRDRWGGKVFETLDLSVPWDGKLKGTALNSAVFIYNLDVTFIDGSEENRSGHITLLR